MSQQTPPEQPPTEVEINFLFVQKSLAKIIKEAPRKFKQVKDEAQKVQGNFKKIVIDQIYRFFGKNIVQLYFANVQ